MKESEWLTSWYSQEMFEFIRSHSTSDRKKRLFACACCRRIWHLLKREESRNAVEVAERLADGEVTEEERKALFTKVYTYQPDFYADQARVAAASALMRLTREAGTDACNAAAHAAGDAGGTLATNSATKPTSFATSSATRSTP